VIKDAGGTALSLPIQDSIMTEDFIKKINALILKAKEE
jgi:hypothetical protein